MKKTAVVLSLAGVIILTLTGWSVYNFLGKGIDNSSRFGKDIYQVGKTEGFNDLKEVENAADEIVIAEKTYENASTVLYTKYGGEERIAIAYTLSDFKVDKVIHGDHLKTGETFTILENEAYNKKQKVTYHIAGYNMMRQGTKYLLFLEQSETDPYYLVVGVNFGKVDLERSETDPPKGLQESTKGSAQVILEAHEQHEKIRESAKKKYAEFIE
ncbi:hypothetical protein [Enterococcus mediterraneensis]|uniref:hypothetical protein n=1 Tax=Enterococcus mediterraneensis TaxID=2364791 RepID=UPI000F0601E5|nr:hypothetical protein [Enterococcus mediterraneensis]